MAFHSAFNRLRVYCAAPRAAFAVLLTLSLFALLPSLVWAQDAAPQGNATESESAQINRLLSQLDRAVAEKDANTLRFFGIEDPLAAYSGIRLETRVTHLATSPFGALVRQLYRVSGASNPGGAPVALSQGTHEFFLSRDNNDGFRFTTKHWRTPDDAVPGLAAAARDEWSRPAAGKTTPPTNSLLHLVAMRRGGRWIALRRSRWDGALLDARALQNQGKGQTIPAGYALDPEWLRGEMNRAPAGGGTAHFLFQRSANGWVGLGTAWSKEEVLPDSADNAATQSRRLILGTSYATPSAHQAFGISLAQVGLYNEAADELAKADALEPGSVGDNLLKQVTAGRARDPEMLALSQLQNEARVGLDPNHPSYLVSALVQDYKNQPSILRALRLGLEYSRLGDDVGSAAWLGAANELGQNGGLRNVSASDQAWIEVLFEHLQERKQLAAIKPPLIIRSPLFVLRTWPNDLSAVQVLAALEASQHTVYADFNIPMSCTEVLLWRNQAEFQRYTTKFSAQGQSEFVAALTLTKLISTQSGPVVLGEEVNVFTDSRTAVFHTVAHEYGHVAVRQLSLGRNVPTWFNEGIATSVEGGYDGYLERVRAARNARALISMDEMLEWNVDGERAFLAYSQAGSIIDYIVATWGKEAVLNVLRQIGNDVEPDEAFQRALGVSQTELWRRWAKDGIK